MDTKELVNLAKSEVVSRGKRPSLRSIVWVALYLEGVHYNDRLRAVDNLGYKLPLGSKLDEYAGQVINGILEEMK